MVRLPIFACIRTFTVAVLLALALIPPAFADIRVALVIGNGAYRNVPRLPNPANDASDVAAALRRSGFDVILATDVDRTGMEDATVKFARVARTADVALFYYSGHALQFSGVNYLAPVDAVLNDEADLLRMTRVDDIVANLQQAKNLRILVLDSCRDDPLAEQLRRSIGATRALPLQRGLAKIDTPQGMIVAYATQAGQTAEDGDGRNSPYTKAFLKHIEEQDEIGTIFREISEDVYETTRHTQLPELSLSMIGRAYLRGMSTTVRPEPPAPSTSPAPADTTRSDFEAAERVDTVGGWDAFLRQHTEGFYADLARERRIKALAKLAGSGASQAALGQTPLGEAVSPHPPATSVASDVRTIFEKYRLLATFAPDCGKPASPDNPYYTNRLLSDGTIDRRQMTGPSRTAFTTLLDKATELKPNEIAVSGTREGTPTDGVWRIEDGRMLQMEASIGGEKIVGAGRLLRTGQALPWLSRCEATPAETQSSQGTSNPAVATATPGSAKAIFEKYKLIGTFAYDCSRPAAADNYRYVNRARSDGTIERVQMSGPTTTDWMVVLDKAAELRANEITVSGVRDGKPTDAVWYVEDKRMRQMEVTLGGQKFVSNARVLQSGREVPWLYSCGGG
jgi:hypothetical protein